MFWNITCVNKLGSNSFSQSIKCNIVYANPTTSGEHREWCIVINYQFEIDEK